MPIYQEREGSLSLVRRIDFAREKDLQALVERNLNEVFGCRFVASEFYTGSVHSGRIDTLALSEDGNPVIIEYKKVESVSLINQALFYLDWIKDHKGDFELTARKTLGNSDKGEEVEIDWSYVRVICIAPKFDRYALHAVKHIGAGIELWQFKKYANDVIEMEELSREPETKKGRSASSPEVEENELDKSKPAYTFEEHLAKASEETKSIAIDIREYISGLNASVKEVPQKLYVAYKLAKNIACLVIQRDKAIVYITLDFDESMSAIARDVRGTGHWGTGNLLISIDNEKDLGSAFDLIQRAYLNASGD